MQLNSSQTIYMFAETKIYRLELWVELKQLADGQQLVKWT